MYPQLYLVVVYLHILRPAGGGEEPVQPGRGALGHSLRGAGQLDGHEPEEPEVLDLRARAARLCRTLRLHRP